MIQTSGLIVRPTLLLNRVRAQSNIARMARRAREDRVRFRPHFKTHQSAEIGDWFRVEEVESITVSSVEMAGYFADHGWRDICVAFPVNVRQASAIDQLAAQVQLHLLVESVEAVHALSKQLTNPVMMWIEVDAGYQRSGVAWDDAERLCAVADAVVDCGNMTLLGLLTHAGQTYQARSKEKIVGLYHESVARMAHARSQLAEHGHAGLEISVGDTPACSVVDSFGNVDEVRPGNFVFFDLMQVQIGACSPDDVAVVVACPVVAQHPERHEVVLYGGAVHLSKDYLIRSTGEASYGAVALLTDSGWSHPIEGAWLCSLSQEHGIVRADPETYDAVLRQLRVGDLLAVIPVHSCLAADLLKRYLTLEGQWIVMAPIF